ncbi:MAG: type II secretion system protein [Gammaproteobacteria bacterium]|nr:type II secretion system protein [Gammaproteobacteria bacterium]
MRFVTKQQGFSLVEMAIVLLIIGIGFTAGSSLLSSFKHSANSTTTQTTLGKVKDQVLNFVFINKYLPCPDTDEDGAENRTTDSGEQVCTATRGGVPYLSLGLDDSFAKDAWGNPIRYAVNTNTGTASLLCDKRQAASMFCNKGAGSIPWFNFSKTPPLFNDRGAGNYYVCNESAASCSGTPAAESLESDSAVVVLVAYNQDGRDVATDTGCAATTGAINENCDTDLYYHQAARSHEVGAFFDDVVLSISGYEVKTTLLNNQLSWREYGAGSTASALEPTYEDFDLDADSDQSVAATAGDDVVLIRRDVETAIDFSTGDDYLAIGNDLVTTDGDSLLMGEGDDTLYVVGSVLGAADIELGDGDDIFVLGQDLEGNLVAGAGNDKVWVQGDIRSSATLALNDDNDILWLGDSGVSGSGQYDVDLEGGLGYDILVLENVTDWAALSSTEQSYIVGFELIVFGVDANGSRGYHICASGDVNRESAVCD